MLLLRCAYGGVDAVRVRAAEERCVGVVGMFPVRVIVDRRRGVSTLQLYKFSTSSDDLLRAMRQSWDICVQSDDGCAEADVGKDR